MSLSNSFRSLFFNSVNSTRRRKQIWSSVSSAQPLECRRLLTNTAPTLADVTAQNGTIDATVQDDQSYGTIEITVDFDGDGLDDVVLNTSEGETISIDVSNYIPANQTAPVIVVLTETYSNEDAGTTDILTRSVTIQASGVTIQAMNFEWLNSGGSSASGAVEDFEEAVADLTTMYREVGDTEWLPGGDVDAFGFVNTVVPGANGEKDFEFVVVHGGVMGDIVTLNDIPANSGDGEGGQSDSGNGGGGSEGGWGGGWGDDGDDDNDGGLFF